MIGKGQLWLENYQSIVEYNSNCIIVVGKKVRIQVQGTNLQIEYYGTIDMKITGVITEIAFL
jgi:sporulation protein YqfC